MVRAAYNPSTDGSPVVYLDKMRRNEEKRKEQERRRQAAKERQEVMDAMQRQALAKDPTKAGIDEPELERQGNVTVTRIKGEIARVEREGRNVFCQLGRKRQDQDDATLSPEMVDAGIRIITIYAERMGLGGKAGDENDRVQGGVKNHDLLTTRMERSGRKWRAIMSSFGPYSKYPQLFDLICQDAMETEATVSIGGKTCGKSRWRTIVSQVMSEDNPNAQAGIIKAACAELVEVLKAVEGGVGWKE